MNDVKENKGKCGFIITSQQVKTTTFTLKVTGHILGNGSAPPLSIESPGLLCFWIQMDNKPGPSSPMRKSPRRRT